MKDFKRERAYQLAKELALSKPASDRSFNVHKFGKNPTVTTEAVICISDKPFPACDMLLTTAAIVRVNSPNIADDTAGIGAREITIAGLDENYNYQEEAIATNGGGVSANSTGLYTRIFRSWVSAGGSYIANNVGDITVERSSDSLELLTIAAGSGQSQEGWFSVGANQYGFLKFVALTIDGNKEVNFSIYKKEAINTVTAPFKPARKIIEWDGLTGGSIEHFNPETHVLINPYTDIICTATAGVSATVTIDFEMVVLSLEEYNHVRALLDGNI